VIDVRDTAGGSLNEAVAVANFFIKDGVIAQTVGREGKALKTFNADPKVNLFTGPVVAMIDTGTAGAAEVVASALIERNRGQVVGEKSFGKGSVQTIFPLDDGSALKLTVAKYYTPSHKVIHEHGITPDILVPMTDAEEAALILQHSPGGVESLPENKQAEVGAVHDTQLERAEDVLKGLLIYSSLNTDAKPEKVASK